MSENKVKPWQDPLSDFNDPERNVGHNSSALRYSPPRNLLAESASQFNSEALKAAINETERSLIVVKTKPPEPPAPGSDEEIATIEGKLNLARHMLSETLTETRFDALEKELPNLQGKALVAATNFLFGWRPAIRKMRDEVAELAATHSELLARRKERDRLNPPAAPEFSAGMRVDFHALYAY